MMILLFVAGAAVGVAGTRAWYAGSIELLTVWHRKEMDEIFTEVQRLRAQVATLIGKR